MMPCSTQGVIAVGVAQDCPASMALWHLDRAKSGQGTPQAYARVVVVVVVVDVVVVDVVDVVEVDVVVEVVVVEVVVVLVVVEVDVLVVEVVVVTVTVVDVVVVEFGSMLISKHVQTTVSLVKFHDLLNSFEALEFSDLFENLHSSGSV